MTKEDISYMNVAIKTYKTFKKFILDNSRLSFLSWIVFPIVLSLISVNYLLRLNRPTDWERINELTTEPQVLSAESEFNPLPELKWNGQGLVTFWFDDAWHSQYDPTFSVLDEYGYKGALAVPTRLVEYDDYMNWYQVKRVRFEGWEITAHSRDHLCKEDVSAEAADYAVEGSLEDLHKQGIYPDIYVYTCGILTDELEREVKANYSAARTVDWGLNDLPVKDRYHLLAIEMNPEITIADIKELLNEARDERKWIILMFHQVDYGGEKYSVDEDKLREILEAVKSSGLQVVVPNQALSI